MWFFHQKFNLSARQRRVVMAVIMTMVSTTTRVQAVSASAPTAEILKPDAQTQATDDVPLSRGLVVPDQLDIVPVRVAEVRVVEPVIRSMVVPTSAYTSERGQTDGSPFTMANGSRVHDGAIAANFLKFGTRVRIPDQFGNKIFIVEDRMNTRYSRRVDIWMAKKADAFKWGVRTVRIEILP